MQVLDRELLKEELVYDKEINVVNEDEKRVELSDLLNEVELDATKNSDGKQRVALRRDGRLCKTAGLTHLARATCTSSNEAKVDYSHAEIELSEKVIDDPIRLYYTPAREMCHAAARIFDGASKPADVFIVGAEGDVPSKVAAE